MSQMMSCTACCPSGGRVRHVRDIVRMDGDTAVWAWRCYNCGHVKKPRAPQARVSYDFITQEATADRKLSIRNGIIFHCFNPNGAYARLEAVQDRVAEAVEAGRAKSGALLAHGSFNDYPRKKLFEALDKKSLDRIGYRVTIGIVESAIKSAEEWLATLATA